MFSKHDAILALYFVSNVLLIQLIQASDPEHPITSQPYGYPITSQPYACKFCCNAGTEQCNKQTGVCECKSKLTLGKRCDFCIVGAYMHPVYGCMACDQCPITLGGNGTCVYDRVELMTCNCMEGYTGKHCTSCSDGYYKNASQCVKCDCSVNENIEFVKSCYEESGDCKSCLFTVRSPAVCDYCLSGYHGNDLHQACLGKKPNDLTSGRFLFAVCALGVLIICVVIVVLVIYCRRVQVCRTRDYLRQHMQYDNDKVRIASEEDEEDADFYVPQKI